MGFFPAVFCAPKLSLEMCLFAFFGLTTWQVQFQAKSEQSKQNKQHLETERVGMHQIMIIVLGYQENCELQLR